MYMCVGEGSVDLHSKIKKLISDHDRDERMLLILAVAIALFWLFTASHLWGWSV